MHRRRSLVLSLLLGACGLDAGPMLARFEVGHVDLARGTATSVGSNLPAELAVIHRHGTRIEIRGMLPLRHACDDLQAVLRRDSPGPVLVVEAREPRRHGLGCVASQDVPIAHYEATLTGLPNGAVRVRVRHEYPPAQEGRPVAGPPWVSRVVAERWMPSPDTTGHGPTGPSGDDPR